MEKGVLTSEFWLTIATMIAILICVLTDNADAIPYLTAANIGYVGSRGLAKFNGKKPEVK